MNEQVQGKKGYCSVCLSEIGKHAHIVRGDAATCENCHLERTIAEHLSDREELLENGFVEALVKALDEREHETGLHSKRVACHTGVLAAEIIKDKEYLKQIYWGALLHDIGKIGIPDSILLKHDSLDSEEWKIMKKHPELGYKIVQKIPYLKTAAGLVLHHEERFDGNGYPGGLEGEDIPIESRIFAIIDTLDAITSHRPYKKALSFDTAKNEILKMSGSQFDPFCVEIFLSKEKILREMVEVKCTENQKSD